jgi:hypothetical protein
MTDIYDDEDSELYDRMVEIDRNLEVQARVDLKDVLKTRAGRNVIWQVLAMCGIDDPIETDNDILRNLGKRDIGLQVRNWVFTSDDGAFSIMQSEAFEIQQRREEQING